jgi:hypothetical protein
VRRYVTEEKANCRYAGSNAIVGGMRRATGGADDPGGPGAEQDVGQVRRRSGRLPAIRCCVKHEKVTRTRFSRFCTDP